MFLFLFSFWQDFCRFFGVDLITVLYVKGCMFYFYTVLISSGISGQDWRYGDAAINGK